MVSANLPGNRTFVRCGFPLYSHRMTESPTRVEAFSDGVFAIAITLLILEIRVPHVDHGLWAGLVALWPSYVAFLMSFAVILIMWVNHHELLRTVTFVPFPTAVLAAYLGTAEAKTAVAFYCATFVVNALVWRLLFATMVRGGLKPSVTPETVATVRKAYFWGPVVYLLSTAVALIRPTLGLLVNVSLWILWIRLGYRSERSATR